MKEKIAGRHRFEGWRSGPTPRSKRIRAIHDNMGFTLVCLPFQAEIGGTYRMTRNVNRHVGDKILESNGELHGRILRRVDLEEVKEWLSRTRLGRRRLFGGWWYEVICD